MLENELTDRQREMILLRYYEGLNNREISETLGICPSTVTRTMQRAEQRIRGSLRFYFDYRSIRFDEEE